MRIQPNTDFIPAPIFIVGCGRSGTTMLRLMLDSHPDLAIPGESHFIVNKYRMRKRYITNGRFDASKLLHEISRSEHFRRWELPPEKILQPEGVNLERFSDTIAHVFRAYAREHGKARWGDKTPIYVRSLDLLGELFPSAYFVHIVRDGRDVALSYLDVSWGPSSIWEAARKWKLDVATGMRSGRRIGPSRYLELRYEDLVEDPTGELSRLCDFAHLAFDSSMLGFHHDAAERLGQTKHDEFHRSETRALSPGLRDWSTQMSEKDLLAFEAVSGDLLTELGYGRSADSISIRLQATARMQEAKFAVHETAGRLKRYLT